VLPVSAFLRCCLWLLLSLLAATTWSAHAELPRVVRRLGVADGLSDRAVNCLWQDAEGYLWIGTARGLERFDGYELRSFRSLTGCALPAGPVLTGCSDATGRTWISTRQGLYSYERRTGRLRAVPFAPSSANVAVTAMAPSPDGTIWLAGGNLLAELVDGRVRRRWTLRLPINADPVAALSITGIRYLPTERQLLLQTYRGPALRFDPVRGQLTQVVSMPGPLAVVVQPTLPAAPPLLATAAALFTLASTDRVPQQRAALRRPDWPDAPYHPRLKLAALTDATGRLWLGTGRGQLTRYDPRTGTLENLSAVLAPNFQVNTLLEDRLHNLWIGTEFGLVELDNRPRRFETLAPPPALWMPGHPFSTREVATDIAGNVYVASYAGLFRWQPAADRWTQLKLLRGGKAVDFVAYALRYDGRDTLWIGSEGSGLLSYSISRERLSPAANPVDTMHHSADYVTCLAYDTRGHLWLGDYRGIRRYDPRTRRYTPMAGAGPDALRYYALLPAADGEMYAGTARGLLRLTADGRLRQTWLWPPEAALSPEVLAAWADPTGRLWLGTRTGLVRLDPRTGQQRVWRRADGLADEQVYTLLSEGDSALWLGTQHGLSRLSLRPGARPRNFFVADGLANDEFNHGSAGRLPDGRLVLGGLNGLNVVAPAQVMRTPLPTDAPLLLSGLTLLDGTTGHIIEHTRLPETPLTLAPVDRLLTVRFALADYGDPALHRYEYRLDGLDSRWLALGAERVLRLTTLPAGTYTLRVRASGANGRWSHHQLRLPLTIQPVFWRTPWFATVAVLLTAALLYGLHRLRLRIVLREERLRAEMAVKSRLYALIGHDLRGPVNTFNGLVRLLDHYFSQGQMQRIPALTERVRHSVGQLTSLLHNLQAWASAQSGDLAFRPESLVVRELLIETRDLYATEAETHPATLTVEAPAGLVIQADAHMLRAVLRNLTANALRAVPAGGRVELTATDDPHAITLAIRDNGPGMPDAHAATLTAREEPPVAAAPVLGTGLGLRLVRLFVTRHNGRVEVLTPSAGGTTVRISLPV
jgi:ligand-binding sensor domain-containing protein/signal transduction histidine kinase